MKIVSTIGEAFCCDTKNHVYKFNAKLFGFIPIILECDWGKIELAVGEKGIMYKRYYFLGKKVYERKRATICLQP